MSELYFTLLFTLLFFRELLTLTNMRLKKVIPVSELAVEKKFSSVHAEKCFSCPFNVFP